MNLARLATGLSVFLTVASGAATIQVGPTRTYTTVVAGYNAASAGDTIEIDSGTYTGASQCCVKIYKDNLTIRGVGPTQPVLDANGENAGDKGIFVAYGNNLTVQNLELKNCAGPSGNDAGIRYQPQTANATASLKVQNCYIHDNQDGILTDGDNNGITVDILFDSCEFSQNGLGDGQTHNMYINVAHSFTLQYCYSHDAYYGHEVKTRAKTNYIFCNLLSNENGNGSRNLQLAQGGTAYVVGNVIQKGPYCNNPELISYGGEGNNANPYLYVVNNTLVNLRDNLATFLMMSNSTGTGAVVFENNIIQWRNSTDTVVGGSYASQVVGTTNWQTTDAGLANVAGHDYHLTAASIGAINLGTAPGTGYNGVSLVPVYQPVIPCGYEARPTDATIDIGAYEYVPNNSPTVEAGADQKVVEGQAVQLHAKAGDVDNDPLSYAWTQPAGLPVVLGGAGTADASFTAPAVTALAQAGMTFTVTVGDGRGGQASDSVNVQVYMLGDLDQDNAVDVIDLLIFIPAYGSAVGGPNYIPTCDFNASGSVDMADLLVLVSNFGRVLL